MNWMQLIQKNSDFSSCCHRFSPFSFFLFLLLTVPDSDNFEENKPFFWDTMLNYNCMLCSDLVNSFSALFSFQFYCLTRNARDLTRLSDLKVNAGGLVRGHMRGWVRQLIYIYSVLWVLCSNSSFANNICQLRNQFQIGRVEV